ncbi:MAG: aromatic ring-hydroxylating dioxygenase subunit alpha [Pseudomonadota bacterium]
MPDALDAFLSPAARAALCAPIEEASPFPAIAYTSQDYFDLEVERVFASNWVAIGMAPSLANPGDAHPLWVFGFPLLMVRDEAGTLRVFHNLCAHDGCPVVTTRRTGLERLEAPYHGWLYDLQGRLIAAPFWDGFADADLAGLRAKDVDLKEIRSAVWQGIVFINLSGAAPGLEDFLAPMIEHFSDCDFSGLTMAFDSEDGDGLHRFPAKANWKLLWENYAPDVYHENFVHAMYRASDHVPRVDGRGGKTFEEVNDRGFMGLAFETAAVSHTYPAVELPKIRRLSDGQPLTRSSIMNMYPNLGFLVFPDRVRVSILIPNGPADCEWLLASFYADGAAEDPNLKAERERSLSGSAMARVEDDRICEAVQKARRSPVAAKRFYSPFWEGMLYSFNRQVLDDLERG